jgi:hypothetical protein
MVKVYLNYDREIIDRRKGDKLARGTKNKPIIIY